MTKAKSALVSGCSYTSGYKLKLLDDEQLIDVDPTDKSIYAIKLLNNLGYEDIKNVAVTGANNESIFYNTIQQMLSRNFDLILVQWTYLERLNIQVGLEPYYTMSTLKNNGHDIDLVDNKTISSAWLYNLGEKLRFISNDHWNILQLIRYVNILKLLQEKNKGKIFFINGACKWSEHYFDKVSYNTPDELSPFLQNILQVHLRDDDQIKDIYNMIHDQYAQNGGILPTYWLNLYKPIYDMKIDTIAPDDSHPGIKSQTLFSNFLKEKLNEITY